jgi:hypothetical protein
MRKLLVLCGAFLCLTFTAAAQDSTAAFDAASPSAEPAAPVTFSPADREPWQLGVGFQVHHFGVLGQGFHTIGFNTDITRYLNDWFGIEGTAVFGYGSNGSAPSLPVKTLFAGGGPHIVLKDRGQFEPWFHVLVGLQHFRFTQGPILGSNSAIGFMGGGGVDYKFAGRASWRFQADFIGTRFGSGIDKSYSFGTGLILNF